MKGPLQTLVDAQKKSELKVTFKLKDAHINCHFSARQRVYLAVQVRHDKYHKVRMSNLKEKGLYLHRSSAAQLQTPSRSSCTTSPTLIF